jgi:NAD(P) transhydrogenase subunit alpha
VLNLGVPKECVPGETRVAIVPTTVKKFRRLGFHVLIETGAGLGADFTDEEYVAQGAEIVKSGTAIWENSAVLLKVRKLDYNADIGVHEKDLVGNVRVLVSYFYPA